MTPPFDPRTSSLERRLHDRTPEMPTPALRRRVLAAVDDVLQKKVPATKYGRDRQVHDPKYADLVAGTFLMAAAVLLLLVAMLSGEAASRRIDAVTGRPLLSFVQRAEAAGITLDSAPTSTMQLAVGQSHDTAIPRHRDTLRSIDARSFLQGDL